MSIELRPSTAALGRLRGKAEAILDRTRDYRDDSIAARRDIRGSSMAIELRANRVRQWRGPIFRSAADMAKDPSVAFQWSLLVSAPLEQIAKEADDRLARWPS